MSLETIIGGLTRDEQIVAMELLWKRLTTEDPSAAPPEWHRSVVAERVAAIERITISLHAKSDNSWVARPESRLPGWHCLSLGCLGGTP